jgi:hypothetical protein
MSINESLEIVKTLYEKYKEDPYMTGKLDQYIGVQLPSIFDNIKLAREESIRKCREMINEQEIFSQSFLNMHQYYYIQCTEKFFLYDGLHYMHYSEDDILHHISTTISKERTLLQWKQRTKINIMKRIKESNLLRTIPNTETIQFVIELLFPMFFGSKTQVKYFLTILGDNILKKNQNLIYFVNANSKVFLRELDNYSQIMIGAHLSQSFKHKYHEHEYGNCRLMKINDIVIMDNFWYPLINEYYLDIICVAAHYSNRFGSADNYLRTYSNDDALIQYAFYLKDISPEELIETFLAEYIQKGCSIINMNSRGVVHWKNIQYLWKHFLESKSLPSVIFQQNLKQLLLHHLGENYEESSDTFVGIFSKYMPVIQKFLQFWDETMVYDDSVYDQELEIDEIIQLFKKWIRESPEGGNVPNITDIQVLDLITHFYPDVDIENQKFVYKMRCLLWDKTIDIRLALESIREYVKTTNTNLSIYDAYEMYCKEGRTLHKIIVNKYFFEKFIFEELRDFLVDEKFIKMEWFLQG